MRSWLNDAPYYMPPVPLGGVIRAFAVGKVIESNHSDSEKGETVCGLFDWQQLAVSNGSDVMRKVTDTDLSPSLALGLLGLNGITAYFGLLDVCPPQTDETVIVSTATGAVGSCVGQIAKIKRLPYRRNYW